ncbi:uncharacterized protein PgNI_04470 [Pyricularia grisea]|uniref:Zn(2)-C6 fungal-type domain-containing protein n=1 Tax=Pyricularia grisea TaxID=148305 RepID=A0A6P8BDP9_PYRGI|nr:uncharacterized protein PgNI_04470 [Pyricularia grisea]TLD13996.1 hypothetical protein PgNI_04470 [Pyricularia grisea]
MSSGLTSSTMPETCSPAPYGKACVGCSRAKCKCYTMSNGNGKCERCHRLGKVCEPPVPMRKKRKATQHSPQPSPSHPSALADSDLDSSSTARLEEKLDSLVSLLRSQGVTTDQSSVVQSNAVSSSASRVSPGSEASRTSPAYSCEPTANNFPSVILEASDNNISMIRTSQSSENSQTLQLVMEDIAAHVNMGPAADEQFDHFRRCFLVIFPFIRIPPSMTSDELRQQSPFLWLTIMSITAKSLAKQFAMEETIWSIISKRVVTQRRANMDLLLGLICFTAWSHYFKQDRPFLGMLSHLATSVALELNLHKDVRTNVSWRGKFGRICSEQSQKQVPRTLDERRTMLAVWSLTSWYWAAYRKAEPMTWTSYLSSCLRALSENSEYDLDLVLAAHVKSHLIANQVTCSSPDDALGEGDDPSTATPPSVLIKVLLRQLSDIRQSLPPHIQTHKTVQLNLLTAELTVRATCLNVATSDTKERSSPGGTLCIQRLRDLEATLITTERWRDVFFNEFSSADLVGVPTDSLSQFTLCMVVAFRLTMVGADGDEPGWDAEEMRRRIDVFGMLDRAYEKLSRVQNDAGIVADFPGPRLGIWQKSPMMFRMMKALLMAELPPGMTLPGMEAAAEEAGQHQHQQPAMRTPESMDQSNEAGDMFAGIMVPDQVVMTMADEPWLSELWGPSWDTGQQSAFFPVDFSFTDQM